LRRHAARSSGWGVGYVSSGSATDRRRINYLQAKTFSEGAHHRLEEATRRPTERAKQEIDNGRRGRGYIFGAFQPASGEAFTQDHPGSAIASGIDFLEDVEERRAPELERVYAILDNLNTHQATMRCASARPLRWAFTFQPTCEARLNLLKPWWKVMRSPSLKDRRFET
jgi:hypothetical protein